MPVVPYVLPTAAAAAAAAYLNARHSISYDYALLSSLVGSTVRGALNERRDRLNLFYALESHAQSSRAAHPWIIFDGQTWTYAQAYETVLKYATWLLSKGVQKDDIVAMDFANGSVFVWVWFGLWSIGAKPAFVNYNLTGKPLAHTIATSAARLVLVDAESKAKFVAGTLADHVEAVFFDGALEDAILALSPTRLPDAARGAQKRNSMAMLIYTSGTTGLPKPAIMAWGKCSGASRFVASWLALKNEVVYTSMPLYHSSASVLGVSAVLQAGGTICLSRKFSHKTFWPEVRSSRATVLHYVGETCRYLLAAPPSPLDKSHHIHAAFGNGLRPDVWEPFKQRFGVDTIYEFYAATEAPGGMFNRSSNLFSSGAIGRNGSMTSLLFSANLCVARLTPEFEPVRDPATGLVHLCAPNEPGELLYKLDPADISQKFQGYFNNPTATNSKIIRNIRTQGDAYFRSGDLLRCDTEGCWWFVDRIGDTFRWKAENVSTAEVADALGRHDAVVEANVYGVTVPKHDGRAGCAAVILTPSSTSASSDNTLALPTQTTLDSLAAHVKKELPAYAIPIWLRVTQAMPMTGTNKQQKHALQGEGIDPAVVEGAGDVLYWHKDGTYVRFTQLDLENIERGGVKL